MLHAPSIQQQQQQQQWGSCQQGLGFSATVIVHGVHQHGSNTSGPAVPAGEHACLMRSLGRASWVMGSLLAAPASSCLCRDGACSGRCTNPTNRQCKWSEQRPRRSLCVERHEFGAPAVPLPVLRSGVCSPTALTALVACNPLRTAFPVAH